MLDLKIGPRLGPVAQAAEILSVSPKTVRMLVRRGDLAAVRIGRAVRIDLAEVEAFIARGGAA